MRFRSCLLSCFLSIGLVLVVTRHAGAAAVISEVLWAGSDLSTSDEWVEIACTGSGSVPWCTIEGWTLTTVNTSGIEVPIIRFGTGARIGSGSVAVVARLSAENSRLLSEPDYVTGDMSLPNTKLLLRLRDANGIVQDTVDDGIGDPFAGSNAKAPDRKASMVRIDLAREGSQKENWNTATTVFGFDAEALALGAPGILDLVPEPPYEPNLQVTQTSISGSILIIKIDFTPIDSDKVRSPKLIMLSESGSIISENDLFEGLNSIELTVSYSPLVTIQFTFADDHDVYQEHVLEFHPTQEGQSSSTQSDQSSSVSSSASSIVSSSSSSSSCTQQQFSLVIQSGTLSAVGEHSINFQVLPETGTMTGVRCTVDFGDGAVSESCNPPSHRFREPGLTEVTAEVIDHCGTTVILSQTVEVITMSSSSSAFTSSRASSTSSSRVLESIEPSGGRQSLVASLSTVVITRVLPNPSGKDDPEREWIEVKNTGSVKGTLLGWSIEHLSKVYELPDIVLEPGALRVLSGNDFGAQLRNSEGSVVLISPTGERVSSVEWTEAQPDQEIAPFPLKGDRVRAWVTDVVDGDTFDILAEDRIALRVRLAGIDTPELTDKNPVTRRLASEAKEFTRSLILEKEVELQFDAKNRMDVYGRLVAEAKLLDGTSIQEALITAGLAWVDRRYETAHTSTLLALQAIAEERHLGIWVHPFLRTEIKEQKMSTGTLALAEAEGVFDTRGTMSASVRISEVFSHPSGGGEEWIEVLNTGTGAADIKDWSLDDSADGGSKPWRIERSLLLDPGVPVLFPKSVTKLSLNDTGDSVRLLAPDGSVVDLVTVPALKVGLAYAWTGEMNPEDPEEAYCLTTVPTPAAVNVCAAPAVKVAKAKASSSKKAAATKKAATTKKSAMPSLLSSLLPQITLEQDSADDVVMAEAGARGSLSPIQILVLAVVAAGAGAVTGGGVALGLQKFPIRKP